MDTKKRQHLQDIYATDPEESDAFTPQVSPSAIKERKRNVRQQQTTHFILGIVVLAVGLSLVYIISRRYIDSLTSVTSPPPITQEYIPRHALQHEAQWVLDLENSFGEPKWIGEGQRPLNVEWLKKAAFNVIMAEKAYEIKEHGEAAKRYENALEIMPDLEGVRLPLGMTYFQLGQFDKALALFKNIPIDTLDATTLNNLGAACIDAESYEIGERYLKRALELNPLYTQVTKNIALLYKAQDMPYETVKYYESYLDLRPDDIDARHDFALYLTKVGRWEQASKQIGELTQQVTDVANLYHLQARIEIKLGNTTAALDATRRAAQLSDPKHALEWMSEEEFDQLRNSTDFQGLMKYKSN